MATRSGSRSRSSTRNGGRCGTCLSPWPRRCRRRSMPPMSCAGAWRPRSIRCSDRPLGGGFVRWTVREPGLRPASHRSSLVRLRARELGISGVGLQAAEQNAPAFANRPLPPNHLKRGPRRTWMLESLSKNLGDIPPGDPVGDGQGIVALAHLDRSCACGGIGEESGSNDGVRQEAPSNLILGPAAPPQRIPLDEIQESGGEGPRRNSNRGHVEKPTAESNVCRGVQRVSYPVVFGSSDEPLARWTLGNSSCENDVVHILRSGR